MKTLAQFKLEEGVATIDLLQGKGRKFATVNNKSVIVATNCDMSKPLFVSHDEEKAYWTIHNSEGAKVVASI